MPTLRILSGLILLSSLLPSQSSLGQFATTINIPPATAPASIGSDTQLNLANGGAIGTTFQAGAFDGSSTNVEVNIQGGSAGNGFQANTGSTINITGGVVGRDMNANFGSVVNLLSGSISHQLIVNDGAIVNILGGDTGVGLRVKSGGLLNIHAGPIRTFFTVDPGGIAHLYGDDFRLNGELVAGLDDIGESVEVQMVDNLMLSGTLADGTPFTFSGYFQDSLGNDTLTFHRAAMPPIGPALIDAANDPVPKGIRAGQTLIAGVGSYLSDNLAVGYGSTLRVEGGAVTWGLQAAGANVSLSDGAIGYDTRLMDSKFEMSGGNLGSAVALNSQVEITGGTISGFFAAAQGTVANIRDGLFEYQLIVWPDGVVNFSGGTVEESAFVQQGVLNISGGNIANFRFIAGALNMSGGTVGTNPNGTEMAAGELKLAGGSIGSDVRVGNEAKVGIFAGSVGDNWELGYSGQLTISGGTVGSHLSAKSGALVNLSGGSIGDAFHLVGGTLSIYGTEFLLDGQPIPELDFGETKHIGDRGVILSGILADGAPFSFDLNQVENSDQDFFASGALVTVQLVETRSGDYNGDDVTDAADYTLWRDTLGQVVPNGTGADGDFSGVVDSLDFEIWKAHFGAAGAAAIAGAVESNVPEPGCGVLAAIIACCLVAVRRARN